MPLGKSDGIWGLLVSFSLKACINIRMWVHTHSRIFPICRAQSHYCPLVMLISNTEHSCCLCILPSAQLMQSDSWRSPHSAWNLLAAEPETDCRKQNVSQIPHVSLDSYRKEAYAPPLFITSSLRISEIIDITIWERSRCLQDPQPCRLLAWKQAVRHKSLKNMQWCIRNSVMLFNTIKSVSERAWTYLL